MNTEPARLPVRCEDGVSAAYEELRQAVLDRRTASAQSHALALFVRQGMLSWMAAWSQCRAAQATSTPARQSSIKDLAMMTDAAGTEIVRVLVEMALGAAGRGEG